MKNSEYMTVQCQAGMALVMVKIAADEKFGYTDPNPKNGEISIWELKKAQFECMEFSRIMNSEELGVKRADLKKENKSTKTEIRKPIALGLILFFAMLILTFSLIFLT